MSLYGINAYTSNSMYNSLAGRSSLANYGKNQAKSNSTADLYELARKAAVVRSPSYQKNMMEELKKAFSTDSAKDSAVGTVESEAKLSKNAQMLNSSAKELAMSGGTTFFDPAKSASAVESFVENYNNTIESLKLSDSAKALEKGVQMVNSTKTYARTLKRIGISVGSDNKLTLDKDALAKADSGAFKSLFTGSYSYAAKVADKSSYISNSAALKSQITYNMNGSVKKNNMNFVDAAFNFLYNKI